MNAKKAKALRREALRLISNSGVDRIGKTIRAKKGSFNQIYRELKKHEQD